MSAAAGIGTGIAATWPADIIHVNEDGWVLINRGSQHGGQPGLRLLVVGQGIRELRDLFAPGSENAAAGSLPLALRIRRTYEQLEVIYAEATCAIAIATRTPPQRRPTVYSGPDGELLVWVPLPEGWTWPHPGEEEDQPDDDDQHEEPQDQGDQQDTDGDAEAASDDTSAPVTDEPPEHGEQEDERWEEALPLNGVSVGDIVVPALPAAGSAAVTSATTSTTTTASGGAPSASSFEQGRSYDWMQSSQSGQ